MSRLERSKRVVPAWTRAWAKDSLVVLASQITSVAVGWLLVVILARTLGPSDFGLFSGLFALSQALAMIVDFGLVAFLFREFTALDLSANPTVIQRNQAEQLLSSAFSLTLAVSASL